MHAPASSLFALSLASALAAQTIVIPNGLAATEGTSSTAYPWGRGTAQIRVLYIYDSAHFTGQSVTAPIVVTQLAWRANGGVTGTAGVYSQVAVSMSTAPNDYTAPNATFASNHGADLTVVHSGPVAVAAAAGTSPNSYYVTIPLQTPFVYDPTLGDLSIEIATDATGWVGGAGAALDSGGAAGNTSRIYNLSNYQSPTGSTQVGSSPVVELTIGGPGFATMASVGTGCPAVTPTTLAASARPVLGTTIQLTTTNVAAGTVIGAQLYGLVMLTPPLDLTPLGMPGCTQYQSVDASVFVPGSAPSFQQPFTLPSNPAFSGVVIRTQSGTLTPGANATGVLLSNGLSLTLGTN